VGECHPVAVDGDQPVGFDIGEEVDDRVGGGAGDSSQQVDGRVGDTCDREEKSTHVAVDAPKA
jgi:hypothetical protein